MKIIIEINPKDENAFLVAAAEHDFDTSHLGDFIAACLGVTAHVEPASVEVLVSFNPSDWSRQ